MADEFVSASAFGTFEHTPGVVLTIHGPFGGRRACESLAPRKVPMLAAHLLAAQHKLGGDEICTMMVLSNSHVSSASAKHLESVTARGLPIVEGRDNGWWVYLNSDEPMDCPQDLLDTISHARDRGCVWLMLDRDGPVNQNLPTFEW